MLSSCISLQVKYIQNSNFKLYQSCNFVDTSSICCVCFWGFFFCIVLVSLKVIQGHDLRDLTRHDPFNNVTLYLDSIPPFPSNKKKNGRRPLQSRRFFMWIANHISGLCSTDIRRIKITVLVHHLTLQCSHLPFPPTYKTPSDN